MSFKAELATAIQLSREIGQFQLEKQHSIAEIIKKSDSSPVTAIDQQSEAMIREILKKQFPDDGFLGEESGSDDGVSGRRWIVDPLDGTRPYIRGIPTHSVLIALEENQQPVLGVIYLPGLDLLCYGVKDQGAFLNDTRISVSSTASLSDAMGSSLGFVERADQAEGKNLFSLMQSWDYTYGFMDAYSYVLLASGSLDVCVNLLDKPWDCAAAAIIIEEAGGCYCDIHGNKTVHNGSILFSNPELRAQALEFFNQQPCF